MYALLIFCISDGFQNVTTTIRDSELTQKAATTAARGWSTLTTQAGSWWKMAADTVSNMAEG